MALPTIPRSVNTDIDASTRDLWRKGVVSQVLQKIPLTAKLLSAGQIGFDSGERITQTVKYQEVDSLMQDYTDDQPMTVGRILNKTKPYFISKRAQIPVMHNADEELYNKGAQPVDLAVTRVQDASRAVKLGLNKRFYKAAATDTGASFNSVIQALNHDATYGGVTRTISSGVNTWFQGADINRFASAASSQDTQVAISINLIRRMVDVMMEDAEDTSPGNLMFLMGPANYIKLKGMVDAAGKYEYGPMNVKYGFESFTIDGVEIVKDYSLTATKLSAETNPQYWVLGLNIADWKLAIHPSRKFNLTPSVWQGQMANGTDSYLARILLAGNLCCFKPNGSIWLSNVQ